MTQASRARGPVRRVSRDRTRPPGPGGRYGLLLLVLIATYLISAFSSGQRVTATVQVGLFAAVLLLALRTSPLPGRWPVLIGVVTMAGSVAAVLGASLAGTSAATGAADLWKALMLLRQPCHRRHRSDDRPGVPGHPGSAPRGRIPLTSRAEERAGERAEEPAGEPAAQPLSPA